MITASPTDSISTLSVPAASDYRWLFIIWLCFIIRGIFYCSVLPLWEGFDEWAHFAVAQNMSTTGHAIIDRNTVVSKEINKSLELAPLPRGMTLIVPPAVTREVYWQLPLEERIRRADELQKLPLELADEPAVGGMPAYEASQPPLYYWILAIVLHPLRHLSLLGRVWVARLVTFLIGSFAIPIGFFLTKKLLESESVAIGITALVVVMPELTINLARVSNESLSIVLYTSLLAAVCSWFEHPESFARTIMIGILLGLGLLTKAYFLTAVPALCLIYFWIFWARREQRWLLVAHAAGMLIISLAIAGWWYIRNLVQTGTLSGLDEALMLRGVGLGEKLRATMHVKWVNAIATVILSHVWYGGWSLLALPRSIYYVSFAFVIVGFCGLLKARKTLVDPEPFSLLSFYSWFWVGQAYQIVMLFLSKSSSTALGGWYLYSVVWAEVVLWIMGVFALVPVRLRALVLSFLIASVATLDLYAVHFTSIPYYAHANGLLDVRIAQLLTNKPALLTGNVLLFLWTAFLGCSALTVIAGATALQRRRQ